MKRVLVVDDDQAVSDIVCRYFAREGYQVEAVKDGVLAVDHVTARPPDLVVLDLMLPGLSGLDVCRRIRQLTSVPVIMLSARAEEDDRLRGLEAGADDYVTKPFSPRELVLRAAAVLRRTYGLADAASRRVLVDGDLRLDLGAHEATLNGELLPLTTREFSLLAYMVRHPRSAFTREQLLDRVWGWKFGDASTVTVHVRRLREKVESDPAVPRRLVTVWGVGYRYEPAEQLAASA